LLLLFGPTEWGSGQELDLSPAWQQATDIGVRAGYKDNVTLSSSSPDGSAFLGVGLDSMVWHELGPRSRFEAFLFGEHRQFLESDQIEKEQTLFGLLQLRQDWTDIWQSGTAFEYLYQDQVIDLTATETETQPSRILGQTFTGRSDLKRRLGGGWLELQVAGTRQFYEEPLDDFWTFSPSLEWTWPVLEGAELSLRYRYVHDWYDNDPVLSESGDPIPGTQREAARHELQFTGRQYFGVDHRWRLTLALSGRINRDNESGYYDYVRPQASLRLRYRLRGWEVEGGVRANYYDYGVQRVAGADSDLRWRSGINADVMVQRQLNRRFRIFLEYNYEQSFSDRAVEAYSVNTVSGGLGIEF
jgi:hypothetical protein